MRSSQGRPPERREHCSADPRRLAAIGRDVGRQVRITRAGRRALYTGERAAPRGPRQRRPHGPRRPPAARHERRVRRRRRLPGAAPDDLRGARGAEGEFIERLRDDGRQARLIVIAPHGGGDRAVTDRQAERVRSRLGVRRASAWRCKGFDDGGPAFDQLAHHVHRHQRGELPPPPLRDSRGFAHAVAFHGFDEDEVLVGGTAAPALKEEVRCALERATASRIRVRIAGPDEEFGGDDPCNVVNRLSAAGEGGIQIEQSLRARSRHWDAIADGWPRSTAPLL